MGKILSCFDSVFEDVAFGFWYGAVAGVGVGTYQVFYRKTPVALKMRHIRHTTIRGIGIVGFFMGVHSIARC
ncbi:hypothetical protein FRX31_005939 [Thalictrum thalictroides]|uniref:Uncharacterized protein n=1 Tax=Thalictrum thalictroides TaxID=46969 RepID=A0A7J6X526_THATH|nr:hypothetical protein FRX31_005939 [Thalictrum thalictroides]